MLHVSGEPDARQLHGRSGSGVLQALELGKLAARTHSWEDAATDVHTANGKAGKAHASCLLPNNGHHQINGLNSQVVALIKCSFGDGRCILHRAAFKLQSVTSEAR